MVYDIKDNMQHEINNRLYELDKRMNINYTFGKGKDAQEVKLTCIYNSSNDYNYKGCE